MPRYQARANVNVSGEVIAVWEVRDLPNTHEVASYVMAGLLVGEDEDGNFPEPVVIPVKCCGQARR